jgi:hypothetical protein
MLIHSHSSIKDYQGCARRYHQVRILKRFKSQPTEATLYGNLVHEAFEKYLMEDTPLPEHLGKHQSVLDKIKAMPGDRHCELKLGMTKDFKPCGFFEEGVWFRGIPDLLVVNGKTAWVGDWKGLALDTKIPTPTGFTTMRDIRVGDEVFDATGAVCNVVGKSQVKYIPCYRVTFSDTSTVICDEEHLWKLTDGSAINVKDLMGKRNKKQRTYIPKIPLTGSLNLPDISLPIDPYVLGLWIADGSVGSGEISKPDAFVWEEIQRRGYPVDMGTGSYGACPTRTAKGLRTQLRLANLLGVPKHIPKVYLRASHNQRLELLQGLMDGDGNANPTRKSAVFTTTSKQLSDDICELLCSLGQRPLQSRVTANGFGKTVTAFPVSFRPININPFKLPRKADAIKKEWSNIGSNTRHAVKVESIPIVPTQCIAVSSPDHTFLCTERMIPTHNTGKSSRYADTSQLELMAAMTMTHFPEVEKVKSMLFFIVPNDIIQSLYKRDQMSDILSKWAGYASMVEANLTNDVWNASPSGLCKFCPVSEDVCEHR